MTTPDSPHASEAIRPVITVTDAARTALRAALAEAREDAVRLAIDAGFQHDLAVGPREAGDVEALCEGIVLLLDRESAGRAMGVAIDYVSAKSGAGFKITNPNEPAPVASLTVHELKSWIDAGKSFELLDVRTEWERSVASIAGSHLLDTEYREHVESLDRSTMLVFQCHHGMRSRAAAEHYRARGFTRVFNLEGGIDAWSREIDRAVPTY